MPEIGAPHKLTHQDGGNDELSVEGLAGDLADAQESTWSRVSGKPTTFDPAAHKTSHQDAGADEISVLGLSGLLGDSQTPLAHKTSHQNGGSDEISVAGLAGQVVFVPYNGKIADITQSNSNRYNLDLEAALSETRKIIGIRTFQDRITGTGFFNIYPNEGSTSERFTSSHHASLSLIADGTQRLQYALTVPNDDWDMYCTGYVVSGV